MNAIVYRKLGKHRKKCAQCGKIIQDGELVYMIKSVSEKYYPVKGMMAFTNYKFVHLQCVDEQS